MKKPSVDTGPLQHANLRRLLAAESLSKLGSEFSLIAVAFAVLSLGCSASDLGLVLMARTLPPLLLLLGGGVWADRLPRARLMVGADLTAFAAQAGLGILFLTGELNLALIMALQAILGSASAMFRPAIAGLVPLTVPSSDLQPANSLISMASNAASLMGPVGAGALMVVVDPGWLVLIDAATFLLSAGFIARLWDLGADSVSAPRGRRFWSEAGEGLPLCGRDEVALDHHPPGAPIPGRLRGVLHPGASRRKRRRR